jgi:hypothetical protein
MRHWIRSHLTYANVTTTILLFLVLGGGSAYALAGSNTVFSDDIVNGQVKSQDLATPAMGPVFARIRELPAVSGTRYGPVSGTDQSQADEADASMVSPSPRTPFVAGHMAVRVDTAPNVSCPQAPNCSRTFTFRVNGADTPVSCTISGSATGCNSGNASTLVASGRILSIKSAITSGSPNNSPNAAIGWVASQP